MNAKAWKDYLSTKQFETLRKKLYGEQEGQRERYAHLLELYEKTYGAQGELSLFSAPGRTEIGGNHTDHQRGRVLAASVNMDMIAAAEPSGDDVIAVKSEGYPECRLQIGDLEAKPQEKNTTIALIRGVAAAFAQRGCPLGGFRAVVTSGVLPGSGISSSAAFETLIGQIINGLFAEGKESPERIAMMGQYAENVYFGKPSGLMDQMACSVGNILTIDFEEQGSPRVRRLSVDFDQASLALCITNCGADHADLTDEYASIPQELRKVCGVFGREVLRQIPQEEFFAALPRVRKAAGDRAVLRAMHFYGDNDRVPRQAEALEKGEIARFLELVNESGISSWTLLQNIVPTGSTFHQEMALALAVSRQLLGGRGACRVHGGGFAGTIQAFVPKSMLEEYRQGMERVFGEGSCHVLKIRPVGGLMIPMEG